MDAPATHEHEIHELLRARRSPRAFDAQPLREGELDQLLEAARWAPSCFNAQPWRFVVAPKEAAQHFERMLHCLGEKNQVWARRAGLLLLVAAQRDFDNGRPNAHAWHDVGLAMAQLTFQATALGLGVHQMAGFDGERAREALGLPEDVDPVTVIAVGRVGDPEHLPEPLRARELAPRRRLPLAQLVHLGHWRSPEAGEASAP